MHEGMYKSHPKLVDLTNPAGNSSLYLFRGSPAGFEKMNRKPGDWTCRSCQHLNFGRRDSCQRCGDPRPSSERSDQASFGSGGAGGGSSFGSAGSDVRPGDWYCSCGAHNFASRSSCFKCAAPKEDSAARSGGGGGPDGDMPRSRGYGFGSAGGGRSGWKSGDWICNSCKEHNFASRTECFRCSAPRDSAGKKKSEI